jgi:hypothetical protein
MFDRSIKVRLKVNLTQYHPGLVAGAEGMTAGASGIWSRGSDRFTGVRFPSAGTFDILWESLEIIDEQFLAERAASEQKKWEQLKEAKDVVRYVGPKGGFKYLSYQYPGGNVSTGSRDEADKLIEFFKQHGISVREERWK